MLTKREFLKTLPAAAAARPARTAPSRPNLVLFLSDDHGYFDSPVYGSKAVRTPAMERIASEGTVFENAFAGSPTCVPSRAIMMTGLYSPRNGAKANHTQLGENVRVLPSYLKERGYRVAHFGKSHFQPAPVYKDWEWVPSEDRSGGPLGSDLQPEAVGKWLAARANPSQPVCLIVCSHSPHVYWEPNQGYDPAKVELPPSFADTPETRAWRAQYYTDITKMDRQLGQVYSAVRKHLGGNTLFLYTSDNGAQWPFAKWTLYDAGIRLPFLASWPGVVKKGARTQAMISFTDLLPTFLELAGGKPPADLDGRSFASVLTSRAARHHTEVYASHFGDKDMNVYPIRTVRGPRFHYILNLHPEFEYTTHIDRAGARDGKEYFDSWVRKAATDPKAAAILRRYHQRPAEELYDTAADPHETVNLAARPEHRKTLEELRAKLAAWRTAQNDRDELYGKPRLLPPSALPAR
ncbi:MAG: sulfatase [Gemmatimonadaceae bacterium]|nr:sulfatase [Gemmatimonadaceae bacterium]